MLPGFRLCQVCVCVISPQSFLTLSDPTDCSQPGSSVHGMSLAKILEQVAISSSREFSRPRDQTLVSYVPTLARIFFTTVPPGKPRLFYRLQPSNQYCTATKQTHRSMEQSRGSEINPCTYSQLVYNKGGKTAQWRKDSLFNQCHWENTDTCRRLKLEHFLTP